MRDNDQSYLSSFRESLRFDYYRAKGHMLRYVENRIKWHVYPRLRLLPAFPDHVDIEASSACNMRCPMCFTITDEFKTNVKLTVMTMDLFRKIVDECAERGAFSVRLSWRGEPTLNPHFVEMARYAKQRGIKEVSSLTNLLKLTPAMFEELVDIGMDWLTISFDGMGETYNRIRKPAKFEEAVARIREFHAIKQRKGSAKPVVKIQGVWPAVKENPQAFYETFRGIVDQVAVNPLLDYLRNDDRAGIVYRENFTCPVLWQRLAIGADALVSLCIHDEMSHHIIGDVSRQTIAEIWNGPALREAREAHVRHQGVQTYNACAECFLPRASEPVPTKVAGRPVTINNMVNRIDVVGR
jgi:sulfatase maturation enzyme AslB (radical SAM superfamily)